MSVEPGELRKTLERLEADLAKLRAKGAPQRGRRAGYAPEEPAASRRPPLAAIAAVIGALLGAAAAATGQWLGGAGLLALSLGLWSVWSGSRRVVESGRAFEARIAELSARLKELEKLSDSSDAETIRELGTILRSLIEAINAAGGSPPGEPD